MAEELVVRERARMLDVEFLTSTTIEQILHAPADPEGGRFGYRERALAERICGETGGASISVREAIGEPI